MARKSQPAPTLAPTTPVAGGSSNANPSNVKSTPASKKGKRAAKTSQPSQTMTQKATGTVNGTVSTTNASSAPSIARASKSPLTPKKKKNAKKTETVKQLPKAPILSPLLEQGGKSSRSANLTIAQPPGSSNNETLSTASLSVPANSDARASINAHSNIHSVRSHESIPVTEASSTTDDDEIFRLAAATPVPISPVVERQFYESQLLLYVLEKVRGGHSKRQNYHGELDQDSTELRRSFVDKLAYICDFKKGGSTVTALALQKTYQGVIFWLAANETVKPKVKVFLQNILRLLKQAGDGMPRKVLEKQLMAKIAPFNDKRLDYYWSALDRNLDLCVERLGMLQGSTDGKPSPKELTSLKNLLVGLRKISKDRVELVRECFEARKTTAFDTLSQLTGSGKPNDKFFDDIRHLLGRLGEHLKAAKTLASAALRFPAIFDDFEIRIRVSPPSRCYFQSTEDITLDGMASRIFLKETDINTYQEALENLERASNGALFERLKEECCFKTRVHAELLLIDLFYWKQFEFLDDDQYIGCSKPACYNCFQYILAHPGHFTLPACHNKLYLAWRTPDIAEENVSVTHASKIRESITSKMNSNARAELRRQIDGRCARRPAQYDSVTGTSSSVQDVSLRIYGGSDIPQDESADMNQLLGYPDDASSKSLPTDLAAEMSQEGDVSDESDDDLSWYKSRVEKLRII